MSKFELEPQTLERVMRENSEYLAALADDPDRLRKMIRRSRPWYKRWKREKKVTWLNDF